MTLKKSIGIGSTLIVLLCLAMVISYGYMSFYLAGLQDEENFYLDHDKILNNGQLELSIWIDQMEQHVLEGWPFEGKLDHSKTSHVSFIDDYKGDSEDEQNMIYGLKNNHLMLHQTAKKIVEAGEDEKMDIYLDEFKLFSNAAAPLVGGISNILKEKLHKLRTERILTQNRTGYLIMIASISIVVIIVLAAVLLFRMVLGPIASVSDNIKLFGDGNLDVSFEYNKKNEIGDIAENFNKT
ncbi:MAG TPA: HAMP domain-containing protein, partial [bacterium]|nr:HAMP domain-containing protein [bacterium]